jgi:hypothetical protein
MSLQGNIGMCDKIWALQRLDQNYMYTQVLVHSTLIVSSSHFPKSVMIHRYWGIGQSESPFRTDAVQVRDLNYYVMLHRRPFISYRQSWQS